MSAAEPSQGARPLWGSRRRAPLWQISITAVVWLVAAMLAVVAPVAGASEGADLRLAPAPVNRLDDESLQRGARNFVNYCLSCHSAKYMRYGRLEGIGIDESMIQDNLMFAGGKIGDTMTVAMPPADAVKWLGVAPPDLSLASRIRGREWLYNYLLGFYRDDKAASGWNNLVFKNVGMPHVLWELSGTNKLVEREFEDQEKAIAAAIAVKGLALVEPAGGGKFMVETVAPDVPGRLTRSQYEAFVADLVNYMDYMAEPYKNTRINVGIVVLMFLGVLFVFAYAMKREYWKDVH